MKTYLRIALLAIVAAAAVSCGNQDTSLNVDVAVPVSVEEIVPKSITKVFSTTGTAYASQEVSLSTELEGNYLLQTNPRTGKRFALGDIVEAGQPIVVLDAKEYENGIMIESKKLDLEISRREFEKQGSLYDKGGVTLREYKNSESTYINSKYAYENALLQLAKTKIKAPFKGAIVELAYFTQGNKVPSGTLVVKIMDYSKLYLEVQLPEKQINTVSVGQPVFITHYTQAKDTLRGKVAQLSPAIDAETRTFKGAMVIDNPELSLRPGMFVKAEIVVAHKDSAIVVPKEVITYSNRGEYVFVKEKKRARERRIEIGLENQTEVEVVKGLEREDRLIVKGFETLKDRSNIKVLK